ncbi:MAG: hypothetical protein ACXADW_23550 [Candidatus Hodarchaeales archaeon]
MLNKLGKELTEFVIQTDENCSTVMTESFMTLKKNDEALLSLIKNVANRSKTGVDRIKPSKLIRDRFNSRGQKIITLGEILEGFELR